MVQEAEKYAEDDTKKREVIDTKNQADSMIYQARKQLSEFSDKLGQDLKDQAEKKASDLEAAIKTWDIEKIKASMKSLQEELMKMGTAMYDQQAADQGKARSSNETQTNNNKSEEEEVIDADFTHKK